MFFLQAPPAVKKQRGCVYSFTKVTKGFVKELLIITFGYILWSGKKMDSVP